LNPQIDTVKIRTFVGEISQKPLLVLCFIKILSWKQVNIV